MEHIQANPAVAHGQGQSFDTKAIWRTFRILLIITVVELILAIGYYEIDFSNKHFVKHVLNGIFVILTLTKAFYIIAEFMHLGHEIKNLIMTIVVPLALFIWFITAFLIDGNSFRHLRNTYDPHFKEQSTIKVEKKEEKKEETKTETKEAKPEEKKTVE
jgi:cytochrome c oxidase subunit IV